MLCFRKFKNLTIPSFINTAYWKCTCSTTLRRYYSSSNDNAWTSSKKNFIPVPSASGDTFEIYDNPYENHWEEDPEFDYTEVTPKRPFYPFITDQASFELSELIMLLRSEGIKDIVCLSLPENPLAVHMVIGSGNTNRHVRSTATLIQKIMKHKHKANGLSVPRLEGLDSSCEWIAISLGDILLHLFLPQIREYYDLESLWSAGSRFDEKVQFSAATRTQNQNQIISWDCLIAEMENEKQMVPIENSKPKDR